MIADMKALFIQLLFTATSLTVKDVEMQPDGREPQPLDPPLLFPGKNVCWCFLLVIVPHLHKSVLFLKMLRSPQQSHSHCFMTKDIIHGPF